MRIITTVMLVGLFAHASAQSASLLLGAAGNAMGNATACRGDAWSLLNNPGGLSEVKRTSVAATHHFYPALTSFGRSAVVLALPAFTGTGGLAFFRFGDDLYNEQVCTAAFSNQLGIASLGIAVRYIQYSAQGFGTRGVFAVSFGGIARISKVVSFGAYITNINQPEISSDHGETIPARVASGLSFQLSEKVTTSAEVEKELGMPLKFKSGLSYDISGRFCFRTGINLGPNAAFAGLGFKPRRSSFDYAAEYHIDTGLRHQFTVGYQFLKK